MFATCFEGIGPWDKVQAGGEYAHSLQASAFSVTLYFFFFPLLNNSKKITNAGTAYALYKVLAHIREQEYRFPTCKFQTIELE